MDFFNPNEMFKSLYNYSITKTVDEMVFYNYILGFYKDVEHCFKNKLKMPKCVIPSPYNKFSYDNDGNFVIDYIQVYDVSKGPYSQKYSLKAKSYDNKNGFILQIKPVNNTQRGTCSPFNQIVLRPYFSRFNQ